MERRETMHRHVKNKVWVWNYIPPHSDIDQASKLQYQTSDMLEHQYPLKTCPMSCNNSTPNIHCYKIVYDQLQCSGSGDSLEFETYGTLSGCCTSNIKKDGEATW
jgi:hypothetical protein